MTPALADLIVRRMYGDAPRPRRRGPRFPQAKRQRIYARDGFACVQCGATEDLTLDHIIPWSRGGYSTYENLQTLCLPCNRAKADR